MWRDSLIEDASGSRLQARIRASHWMINVSASLPSTDRRRRVENNLSSLNSLFLLQPSVLLTHLHSYILIFS